MTFVVRSRLRSDYERGFAKPVNHMTMSAEIAAVLSV